MGDVSSGIESAGGGAEGANVLFFEDVAAEVVGCVGVGVEEVFFGSEACDFFEVQWAPSVVDDAGVGKGELDAAAPGVVGVLEGEAVLEGLLDEVSGIVVGAGELLLCDLIT